MTRSPRATHPPRERVLVCGLRSKDAEADANVDLEEIRSLVEAAEGEVVGEGILQKKDRPDPATLFGRGKLEEIGQEIARWKPDLVVIDNDLTPAQARNLEKALSVRVLDRSELILDLFARRAKTRQARLQVELAQSEYLAPRLRRMWTHLERTEGAIGTRGPGETQLETDKRLLKRRILDLKEQLKEIEARKQREVASRSEQFKIGLVGYTNAGKSTLLNRLTGSEEFVADMLFATLDTRTRQWRLPDGRMVLLSDTVGFLQRLPHHLVASFHATLEEALAADLLLHVVDASHPDVEAQMDAVDRVLGDLGAKTHDQIVVFNKIDRVQDPISLQYLRHGRDQEVVHVSATTGAGLADLVRAVTRRLDERSTLVDVHLPIGDGRIDSWLHRHARPIEDEFLDEVGERRIRLRLTEAALGSLRRFCGGELRLTPVGPSHPWALGGPEDEAASEGR